MKTIHKANGDPAQLRRRCRHRPGEFWKVVRRFVQERFGLSPSCSSCLNYLHRLGFVLKRPKKRFLKADEAKREAFVAVYAEWPRRNSGGEGLLQQAS